MRRVREAIRNEKKILAIKIYRDATRCQIPVGVRAGDYRVLLGIYNPSTGQRWPIVRGGDLGDSRLALGNVTIEPLRPFLDPMIVPTRIDEQRHHAERIVEHHRRPGE